MKPLLHQAHRAPSCQEGLERGKEVSARIQGMYASAMKCLGEELTGNW